MAIDILKNNFGKPVAKALEPPADLAKWSVDAECTSCASVLRVHADAVQMRSDGSAFFECPCCGIDMNLSDDAVHPDVKAIAPVTVEVAVAAQPLDDK